MSWATILMPSGEKALVYVAAHVNVERERFFEVTHHVARPLWTPDFERHFSLWSGRPWREHQVGYADDVVGMQVREERLRHGVHLKTSLNQTLHEPTPRIEQQAFATGLD
jgi:hypothetical protein